MSWQKQWTRSTEKNCFATWAGTAFPSSSSTTAIAYATEILIYVEMFQASGLYTMICCSRTFPESETTTKPLLDNLAFIQPNFTSHFKIDNY